MLGQLSPRRDGAQGSVPVYGRPGSTPADIEIFFRSVSGIIVDGDGGLKLVVKHFAEGEASLTMEQFWAMQLRQASIHEQPC